MSFNKKLLAKTIGAALLTCASTVQAANWLMLQGTEPEGQAARAKLWGFIQAQYQHDTSDPSSITDAFIPPMLIGPNLESQEQFNVNRARIGVRGTGFPLDSKVNYFILAELGNNGITAPKDGSHLTDASITLNHIPGARIRAGLFKTPGAEEGLQAIHVFDYINFTTVTNQMLLERVPNATYTPNTPAQTLPTGTPLTSVGYTKSVSAFRDVGIQVFDMFKVNNWEHSYAVMYGNGNGLNYGDNDDNKDLYLYWSSELVFGGKGGRREGLKMFAWNQDGKRQLDNTNDSIHNPTEFDRERSGLGFKYLQRPWRVSAEYMVGDGMIFVGPDKPSMWINDAAGAVAQGVGDGANGEADGYYLEAGFYIPNTNWEIDLRYDVYNRLTDDKKGTAGPLAGKSLEVQFNTLTLGTQYHINKKTRINAEAAFRDFEAVDWASGVGPNSNLDNVDTRYAIQLTHIF
ncbi:MAG: hypothetical protein KAJ32_10380 [Gammaproteobacteria bacterium]|nr:hypothetical protein [Gammaproteobacteria bacterium]